MTDINELFGALNEKQRRFVEAYAGFGFAPRKASEALRAAGLANEHTSAGSTWTECWRLLRSAEVKAVIKAALSESYVLSAEQVLARQSEIATADIGDILDPATGKPDIVRAIQGGKTYMLRSVSYRPTRAGVEVKAEIHDPQPALRALGAAHNLDKGIVTVEAGDKLTALLAGLSAPWANSGQGSDDS